MIKKILKHKNKLIIGTSFLIFIGSGILYANTTTCKGKIKLKINELYYSQFENKEYKNEFKDTLYMLQMKNF